MLIPTKPQCEPSIMDQAWVEGIRTCAEVTKEALVGLQTTRHAVLNDQSSPSIWPSGSTVGVSFIGGTDSMRGRVAQYANIWTQHANITFDFNAPYPASIRIAFIDEVGSWSFLGTSCELVPVDKPTMNLAWLSDDTPDGVFAGTVLHEFGHALGCIHVHIPGVRIDWNRVIVCGYFKRTQGWSVEDVQRNVFRHYESDRPQLRSATFDPRSIMLYPIPRQFTSGQSVGWNVQLSDIDIQRICDMYPHLSQFLDTGSFLTNPDHPDNPARSTKGTIHFAVAKDSRKTAPRIVLGVNQLEMDRGRNIRLSCDVLSATEGTAEINLRSWEDTLQYSAGCSWLAISPNDLYCQTGEWSLFEDFRYGFLPLRTTHRVLFKRAYPAIPKVAVWLSRIDCNRWQNLRANVYATDVTRSGFTLHLDTWANTELYMLAATWLAHPADRADIVSGTIEPELDTSIFHPRPKFTGTVSFEDSPFTSAPRVFMAFSRLEMGNGVNPRVKASSHAVTRHGMRYTVEAWGNAIMHSASCTYLAIV